MSVATVVGAAATEQWLLDPEGQGVVHRAGEVQASPQALNKFSRTEHRYFLCMSINAFSILIRHSLCFQH